jgi:folate-binding protein YgfZ
MSDPLESQVRTLKQESGFVELPNRFFVRLSGDDRKAFLHNFCTNEIKGLGDGQACEAFVLNSKGKLLGYGHVLATEADLLLTGHGDQAETLISHLDKYLIREDVNLSDATSELGSVFVCGQQANEHLAQVVSPNPAQNHLASFQTGDVSGTIANLEIAGFGFLLIAPQSDLENLKTALADAGIGGVTPAALEIVRVEQKTPWFGIDADESNLPQELQRDEKAISFDKGCYLGQETVARIDARGRVNNLLVGLEFPIETPPSPGDPLVEEDNVIGRITSVAYSFQLESNIGMGFVRRKFVEPGTRLRNAVVLG